MRNRHLSGSGNRELSGRGVGGDRRTSRDRRFRAHHYRRDELTTRSDVSALSNRGTGDSDSVVIARDGPGTERDAIAERRIAHESKVIDPRPRADVRILHLDKIADLH